MSITPTIARRADRARLSIAWELHDFGYRLQAAAHRLCGEQTPGPAPLYINALWELTHAAGISAGDLLEQTWGGTTPSVDSVSLPA